jgi:hypothetical protein
MAWLKIGVAVTEKQIKPAQTVTKLRIKMLIATAFIEKWCLAANNKRTLMPDGISN